MTEEEMNASRTAQIQRPRWNKTEQNEKVTERKARETKNMQET